MSSLRLVTMLAVAAVVFVGVVVFRPMPAEEQTPSGPANAAEPRSSSAPNGGATVPELPDGLPTSVGYVVSRPGAMIESLDEAIESGSIAAGALFPVLEIDADRYRILTNCNTEAWVPADQVMAGTVPIGGKGFGQSVFVVDAGHGLPDYGAVGPAGLAESEVNLDVAARLVQLLSSSHDIDWETGEVTDGSSVPPAATAILTRPSDGPNGGAYELGLTFRATVANSVHATALVSIHHNSGPQISLDHPGSEALVGVDDPESARLGGLIVQELRTSFARFEADWMGGPGPGLITRVDEDGSDYYTLLEHSETPAVIVEGVYISNASEEALAMTDDFRQTYATAVYRALVRFVTTDDDPLPAPDPVLWNVEGTVSTSGCDVPRP